MLIDVQRSNCFSEIEVCTYPAQAWNMESNKTAKSVGRVSMEQVVLNIRNEMLNGPSKFIDPVEFRLEFKSCFRFQKKKSIIFVLFVDVSRSYVSMKKSLAFLNESHHTLRLKNKQKFDAFKHFC